MGKNRITEGPEIWFYHPVKYSVSFMDIPEWPRCLLSISVATRAETVEVVFVGAAYLSTVTPEKDALV